MHPTAFSVIIPAYNEAPSMANVLARVTETLRELGGRYETELVVVNDGSSDGTAATLESFASGHPGAVRIVTHERNRGLEAAIVTGVRAATHGIVVLLDADLSYAPGIIEPLVARLVDSGAAAVLASPYMAGGRVANVPFVRLWASRGANVLLSLCVGGRIKTFTGMVRAYDARALLPILKEAPVGEFNTWIVASLLAAGRSVEEIPAALIWPRERMESAPRLSGSALRRRTGLVVGSIRMLLKAGRRGASGRFRDLSPTSQGDSALTPGLNEAL